MGDAIIAAGVESTNGDSSAAGPVELLGMITANWMPQAICAAAELRIPDFLASGPRRVDDLARLAECAIGSLNRLMRALASLGICNELPDGFFELTALGGLLRRDQRHSLWCSALWWGRHQSKLWENLLYSVKTGESARKLVTGLDAYGHLESDPRVAAVFNGAMVELTRLVAREVSRLHDFSEAAWLVDVGGGYGELLAVILADYPQLHGTLLERPHAVEGATLRLAESRLAHRCQVIAGDFFESVPAGADRYLLKSVLHNWDDERSALILANCRRAISQKGQLVIVERLLPARIGRSRFARSAARADLNMLLGFGGRERTEDELLALLSSVGFRLARIAPTAFDFSVIDAIPG
jgi:hypothetical protein